MHVWLGLPAAGPLTACAGGSLLPGPATTCSPLLPSVPPKSSQLHRITMAGHSTPLSSLFLSKAKGSNNAYSEAP